MITPTLNLNGSSMADLIEPRATARTAIVAVIEALSRAAPHGRDYPGDNDRYIADREEHDARILALHNISLELLNEAFGIQNQKRERMMTAEDRLLSDLREVSQDLQEWAQDRIEDGYKAAGIIQMLREAARIAGRD